MWRGGGSLCWSGEYGDLERERERERVEGVWEEKRRRLRGEEVRLLDRGV